MSRLLKTMLAIVLLIITVLPLSLMASASTIETFALPSLSSTMCTHCAEKMSLIGEEYEFNNKKVHASDCPNTSLTLYDTYHTHTFKLYYNVYECSNCGFSGRMYVKTTMQCSIAENPFSLKSEQ